MVIVIVKLNSIHKLQVDYTMIKAIIYTCTEGRLATHTSHLKCNYLANYLYETN